MPRDRESEREEQERRLQAQQEVKAIEAGDLVCPWCQKYVNPREWWTHIDANPYEEGDGWGPTLFHKGCGARVPDKKKDWVQALRECFNRSPIKPGDCVQVNWPVSWAKLAGTVRRVINIGTDENVGPRRTTLITCWTPARLIPRP